VPRGKFAEDLTGRVFGRLTVLEKVKKSKTGPSRAMWLCKCECGTSKTVRGSHLRAGKIVKGGLAGQ
jgi:hypothetical protein